LFSDNVPIEQERELKTVARRKNLLVMGPDCGTAVINGVPLGFANIVRRGAVGLVGASGTGLQEIMCQVHRLGEGLSHAIGTGSRDVTDDIGGATMLQGLDLLAADKGTKVIAIISKPPAPAVQQRVLAKAASLKKPVVVCFLGGNPTVSGDNMYSVATLRDAAAQAVALAKGSTSAGGETPHTGATVDAITAKLKLSQRFIRGLYSGGTFCSEAQVIWQRHGITAHSNVPLNYDWKLEDENKSVDHTAIDLGSDEFTVGRPHPMIDYSVRIDRLHHEARDPTVACIVLDVVLGYGSHENPASVLAPAIRAAKASARQDGRELPIICFVCGTDEDPQHLASQTEALVTEGVILASGSTDAAKFAAGIAVRMASNETALDRRAQQG
jgi:succinyl-CoA synthetase alpha subunit